MSLKEAKKRNEQACDFLRNSAMANGESSLSRFEARRLISVMCVTFNLDEQEALKKLAQQQDIADKASNWRGDLSAMEIREMARTV